MRTRVWLGVIVCGWMYQSVAGCNMVKWSLVGCRVASCGSVLLN